MNARVVFGVFGLVGVLVTIAAMGVLGVRVLDGMGSSTPGITVSTTPAEAGAAGNVVTPAMTTPAASAIACDATRQTLQVAIQTFELSSGGQPPADLGTLVTAGFLSESSNDFEISVDGKLSGIGTCAGH